MLDRAGPLMMGLNLVIIVRKRAPPGLLGRGRPLVVGFDLVLVLRSVPLVLHAFLHWERCIAAHKTEDREESSIHGRT
jgi:hypothetical protein